VVADARTALTKVEPFTAEAVQAALDHVVAARGSRRRDVFQAVRVAVTGTTVSPGLPETLAVLGREETLRRLEAASAS
jgi:glutamyl-tRNA synthetase